MIDAMSEFDLIKRFFTRTSPNTILGVGDDAALIKVRDGMELAVSSDMLVSGTHFFPDVDPYWLGHKTLAVNLSDIAAMGGEPRWATLALSLPNVDAGWLEKFSEGFFSLAERYGVDLIGGDTTRGPLNLCVTIMGEVPKGGALRRDGAKLGDEIWVSGTVGSAALALSHLQGKIVLPKAQYLAFSACLHQPQPRVELGLALRGVANSAIDISDGLLADLGHILERSCVGADIFYANIPRPPGVIDEIIDQRCILAGGDDYELCFTAPVAKHAEIEKISARLALSLTCIGKIKNGSGSSVYSADGSLMSVKEQGYDHFA